MPYRKDKFANDEIYHIILRGIDNNLIFKDINDYYRGIFSIYEFNDSASATIQRKREARSRFKKENKDSLIMPDERDKLVEILSFCFMPNHIHLLIKQIKDNGITKFMGKVGTGYAGYFNRKYKRKGYVFQNRFKDIYVKDDNQLRTVFTYIHTNPISLIEPKWKESGIKNPKKVIKFLEDYKWHSYPDFIGIKNFPSVTEREFLSELIGGINGCKESIKNRVSSVEDVSVEDGPPRAL
ncbi:MAG: hypothetical protein A3G45_00565 [Candidatus Staskawiczbacteria bacterium RIFCSPLOWO2_12_FULL_37_15]|uniref:Transposase IS200-like domain-containing protein n=1 Tax=Candidatus Staskawiczbacteria bacterium RIFCSPLOWO2_12_FULL_37_15 TaxID=1802218 RepID=A0A1G2INB5_9BACT|nr:MAG: hypothetical protein US35_C0021G0013 [Parcubacteria group bacterium GW2011_GWA2_37_10]OGZ76394.1 MAG: hypothetical protein A3G45_00565 [Candidatus Staskawiczbacteria bacterium RIFCSPLOWO2_12_FULL_37_15]